MFSIIKVTRLSDATENNGLKPLETLISDLPGRNYFDPQVTTVMIFQVEYSQIPQETMISYVPLNKDIDSPGCNIFRSIR